MCKRLKLESPPKIEMRLNGDLLQSVIKKETCSIVLVNA